MAERRTDAIERQIRKIITERLEIDASLIVPDAKLKDDLGIDSFGIVEIAFEIKDSFGVDVPEKDIVNIKTVKDIVDYIHEKGTGE